MKDEKLILKIQALVDNELPEDQIPEILKQIEGNYEFRDEYIKLLQLKKRLAGIAFPKLPKTWYEQFEKKKKLPMVLGTILAVLTGIAWLTGVFIESLGTEMPQSWPTILIGSAILSASFFLYNSLNQRKQEKKSKSYEEIIK